MFVLSDSKFPSSYWLIGIAALSAVNIQDRGRDIVLYKGAFGGCLAGALYVFRETLKPGQCVGPCFVEVKIRRLWQGKFPSDALHPGVDEQGEGKVRVCQRVRGAELRAAVLAYGGRETDELGAVFPGPGNVAGRFFVAKALAQAVRSSA